MKKKPEKETKKKSVDFYDWFDSLEYKITPLDKDALLTDKGKEKQRK